MNIMVDDIDLGFKLYNACKNVLNKHNKLVINEVQLGNILAKLVVALTVVLYNDDMMPVSDMIEARKAVIDIVHHAIDMHMDESGGSRQ